MREGLTPFQQSVVDLFAEGLTMDQVAERLGTSRWRVKKHASKLCRIYLCSMYELPAAIAAARRAA